MSCQQERAGKPRARALETVAYYEGVGNVPRNLKTGTTCKPANTGPVADLGGLMFLMFQTAFNVGTLLGYGRELQ